jgi:hypothetical protein
MNTLIAGLALVSLAAGPVFAAGSFSSGAMANPERVQSPAYTAGHVAPSQSDFDKTFQICRPC